MLRPPRRCSRLNGCRAGLSFSAFKSLTCSLQDVWPSLTTNQPAITTLHKPARAHTVHTDTHTIAVLDGRCCCVGQKQKGEAIYLWKRLSVISGKVEQGGMASRKGNREGKTWGQMRVKSMRFEQMSRDVWRALNKAKQCVLLCFDLYFHSYIFSLILKATNCSNYMCHTSNLSCNPLNYVWYKQLTN